MVALEKQVKTDRLRIVLLIDWFLYYTVELVKKRGSSRRLALLRFSGGFFFMCMPLQIEYKNAHYHIMNRGRLGELCLSS